MTSPPTDDGALDVETDCDFLDAELDARDADAFVHVGDRFDADLRYLTRLERVDRRYAFVYADGDAVLCVPPSIGERTRRAFSGAVRARADAPTAGQRAVAVLDDLDAGPTVLVPRHLPHDAALYVERSGREIASTDAVERARATKSPAERERVAAAQSAAVAGMARAATLLADADRDGDELRRNGDALTPAAIRRAANAAVVRAGARPAGNTVVRAGGAADRTDGSGAPDAPLRAGETVAIDLAPREPAGYHGRLARTFVVDGDGGWERRAHVAVRAARDAALAEIDGAGTRASAVRRELDAELSAYGLDSDAELRGVGLRRSERVAGSDGGLPAGAVLAVESSTADPDEGAVRVADLVVVTDGGYERLGEYRDDLSPSP